MSREDHHAGQPVERSGAPLSEADAAVVLAHGRGATARSILDVGRELGVDGVAYLAPQAARNTWYPQSFTAPTERNQPWLDSAKSFVSEVLGRAVDAVGAEHVVLGGFSQGACLASTVAAENPRRYGGVVALSGGLIGPEGAEFDYEGEMEGTPVFLGCSDDDPHIPLERVHETAEAFEALGADVDERIYEGMGHGVIPDEVEAVREIVSDATGD